MHNSRSYSLIWILLIFLAGVVFLAQLIVGEFPTPMTDMLNLSLSSQAQTIVIESRLPAAIAATLSGLALSISGLQMQTYFRNPVAGPFVLGISSGAALGVAILTMFASHFGLQVYHGWALVAASSIGAITAFILVLMLSYRLNNTITQLVVGLMIASFVNGVIEAIQTTATSDSIKGYLIWTMGSYRHITLVYIPIMAAAILAATLLSLFLIKPLNLLLIGEEAAKLAGINVRSARIGIVVTTCLLTGCVTAFCGPIGFIGLAVPHIARRLFQTSDHRVLTPSVMLLGIIISGMCNVLTSIPIHGLVLPINTITSLVGAPFVIWILIGERFSKV